MYRVQDKIQKLPEEVTSNGAADQFGNISQQLKIKTAQLKAAEENSMRGMNHSIVLRTEKRSAISIVTGGTYVEAACTYGLA
jgi:hypothetical protein